MPRQLYTAAGTIAALGTSWQDVIPTVASGRVVLARIRFANYGSQAVTITAGIWNASDELARVLPGVPLDAGHILEVDVRVVGGQRVRAYASASSVAVSIVHGVEQY